MTFDEYRERIPKESWDSGEVRDAHTCNSKCDGLKHCDLIFEIGDTLTEESLQEQYGRFYLKITKAKRVLEYPVQIPGTHVNATGAWEVEYYNKGQIGDTTGYAKGLLNLVLWRAGELQ